ncbi:hypothetical protein K443DRAFT_14166 [Laccaria amethystina LaAM-08-1]|uniref:Uncharacterized protein n=1 Tax=Laccaria amethystina LaAM-08-1 TaxID=1095629 RepID=A0A0C9WN85_9AGAR|nr:hypothetical protein K443DRAFT_14166 [Laccaria amethystina LaAM-08-1]
MSESAGMALGICRNDIFQQILADSNIFCSDSVGIHWNDIFRQSQADSAILLRVRQIPPEPMGEEHIVNPAGLQMESVTIMIIIRPGKGNAMHKI